MILTDWLLLSIGFVCGVSLPWVFRALRDYLEW